MMLDAPTQLGKYRLVSHLATGGMGAVYLARQEGPAGFAKVVVVKRILSHLAQDPAFVEMFLNEARIAAQLSHPNIVQVFELGEADSEYFIAMEYLHGRSASAIKKRSLQLGQLVSPVLSARVCAQALLGLQYAHDLRGEDGQPLEIIHRDISPDNLLVGFDGQVKVLDFGIAKAVNAVSTTRTGTLKGKYSYMAPEQVSGGALDRRTDVYAMGVVLYELTTGRKPFEAPTEPALIHAIMSQAARPALEANADLPPALSEVIMRAIAKEPGDRFQSAEEMSNALEAFIAASGQLITPRMLGNHLVELFGAEAAAAPPANLTPSRSSNPSARAVSRVSGARAAPPEPVDPQEELPTQVAPEASVRPTVARRLPWAWALGGIVSAGALAAVFWPTTPEIAPLSPVVTRTVASEAAAAPEAPGSAVEVKVGVATIQPASENGNGEIPADETPPSEIADKAPASSIETPEADAVHIVAESPPEKPRVRVRHVSAKSARTRAARPGKVALRITPWAEVIHDGKSLGITPMAPVEVPAGVQEFVLRNPQLKAEKRVKIRVPAGGQVTLRADLFD